VGNIAEKRAVGQRWWTLKKMLDGK